MIPTVLSAISPTFANMDINFDDEFRLQVKITENKTGTSKVGAISKAQKAQKTFFEKKHEIFDFFPFRKCRIVPKNVKGGTLWALLTYILLQNIKKLERGLF